LKEEGFASHLVGTRGRVNNCKTGGIAAVFGGEGESMIRFFLVIARSRRQRSNPIKRQEKEVHHQQNKRKGFEGQGESHQRRDHGR